MENGMNCTSSFCKLLIISAFLLVTSVAMSQKNFEDGYYIDNDSTVHYGLCKRINNNLKYEIASYVPRDGFNKLKFKSTKKSKPIVLGTDEIREFKIGNDVYSRRVIGRNITDFVKYKRRGKIDLYIHYSSIPIVPRDGKFRFGTGEAYSGDTGKYSEHAYYYAQKGDEVSRLEYDLLKNPIKVLRRLVADDQLLLNRIAQKKYDKQDIVQLVSDYNARAEYGKVKGSVLVFRKKNKQQNEELRGYYNEDSLFFLRPNTLDTLMVDDIFRYTICIGEAPVCESFSGYSDEITYLMLSYRQNDDEPSISLVSQEFGEFECNRIVNSIRKESKK